MHPQSLSQAGHFNASGEVTALGMNKLMVIMKVLFWELLLCFGCFISEVIDLENMLLTSNFADGLVDLYEEVKSIQICLCPGKT